MTASAAATYSAGRAELPTRGSFADSAGALMPSPRSFAEDALRPEKQEDEQHEEGECVLVGH